MKHLIVFLISTIYYSSAISEVKVFVDPLYRATESAGSFKVNPGDVIPFELFRNDFEDEYEVFYKKNGLLDILVASENDIKRGSMPSLLNKQLPNNVGRQELGIKKSGGDALLIFKNKSNRVVDAFIRIDRVGTRPERVRNEIKKIVSIPFNGFGAIYEMPKINVYVMPCGEVNAYSTPDIFICTELIADLVEKGTIDALFPIILHELAHSLMFIWKIGDYKDEDMADDFATALVSIAIPESINALVDWFDKMDKKSEDILKTKINSRHSLSKKRAENARKMLKNPGDSVKKWGILLQPHVRKDLLNTRDIR
ncbi:DUF4344 domain-containing metallopeptidase [Comamonas aquatica]|uniref:DUF4344 domain-containing metallopeptidase n=1 Tax=Comamonas aquatica TaxID=225991 RepID=UPI00244CBDE6|nr:DUF4344 domain-containing metallopeptidase [Comamonas aquatica]MDH1676358.1 DUF4344 domain-containing metallopeptidase [Comamonas aquatica]MDH1679919.1 DUF4344 domain-containing metallopeptidase [Comamonas aquatica]